MEANNGATCSLETIIIFFVVGELNQWRKQWQQKITLCVVRVKASRLYSISPSLYNICKSTFNRVGEIPILIKCETLNVSALHFWSQNFNFFVAKNATKGSINLLPVTNNREMTTTNTSFENGLKKLCFSSQSRLFQVWPACIKFVSRYSGIHMKGLEIRRIWN